MDNFTRRYLMALGAVGLVALGYWLSGFDGRVAALNEQLAADPQVGAYPYRFEVLRIENQVATLHLPRSAQMSAIQGLRILYPELQSASAVSDDMVAAQKALAAVQSRAMKLVLEHPDVQRVVWQLDEPWLNDHGVYVQ